MQLVRCQGKCQWLGTVRTPSVRTTTSRLQLQVAAASPGVSAEGNRPWYWGTGGGRSHQPRATRWSQLGCTRGELTSSTWQVGLMIGDHSLNLPQISWVSHMCSYRGLGLSTQMYLQIVRQGVLPPHSVVTPQTACLSTKLLFSALCLSACVCVQYPPGLWSVTWWWAAWSGSSVAAGFSVFWTGWEFWHWWCRGGSCPTTSLHRFAMSTTSLKTCFTNHWNIKKLQHDNVVLWEGG